MLSGQIRSASMRTKNGAHEAKLPFRFRLSLADSQVLSEPAEGNDDRGEWIGCSATKDLSECSGKGPGGSCRDERSEHLQSHSDFLQKDASASMNTGKTPA